MPPLDKATAVRPEAKAHTLKPSALAMNDPNITAYKQITLNKSTQYHMFYERVLPIPTARNRDPARPHHENMMILEHFSPRMPPLVYNGANIPLKANEQAYDYRYL